MNQDLPVRGTPPPDPVDREGGQVDLVLRPVKVNHPQCCYDLHKHNAEAIQRRSCRKDENAGGTAGQGNPEYLVGPSRCGRILSPELLSDSSLSLSTSSSSVTSSSPINSQSVSSSSSSPPSLHRSLSPSFRFRCISRS
ncbi:hypothetical protein ABFS82_13G060800 [Erythranthe guttata]